MTRTLEDLARIAAPATFSVSVGLAPAVGASADFRVARGQSQYLSDP